MRTLLLCLSLAAARASMYSRAEQVTELTSANFDALVGQGTPFLVEFYAPWCGHCKALKPKYVAAAQELEGSGVRVGAVDCDVHKDLAGRFGVKGFPTIAFFSDEGKKKAYNGARDAHSMTAFALESAGLSSEGAGSGSAGSSASSSVPSLSYLDAWPFFYSSAKPTVLLFGKEGKETVPDWFVGLGNEYKETVDEMKARGATTRQPKVRFGFVPASETRLSERFGVTSRPALLAALPEHDSTTGGSGSWDWYPGDVTLRPVSKLKGALRNFIDGQLMANDTPLDRRLPSLPEPDRPRRQARAELHELSPENADEVCFTVQGKTCVIVLLSGAGEDEAEVAMAQLLSGKYRNDPLSFTTLAVDTQPEFVQALGGVEAPAVVVLKTGRRPRFASSSSSSQGPEGSEGFEEEALSSFLDKALGGDLRFTRLDEQPALVEDWERVDV